MQEIGRAGRDRSPSLAVTMLTDADYEVPKLLVESEFPSYDKLYRTIYFLQGNKEESVSFEKINEQCGLTEIQWRYIENHLMGLNDLKLKPDSLISHIWSEIENRIKIKQEKLRKMTNWLSTEGCRRKKLLAYFDEEYINSGISNCCDFCGVDYTIYEGNEESIDQEKEIDWEEELKAIFRKASD
jgi:ATP-dependent DNA helicase RecQ